MGEFIIHLGLHKDPWHNTGAAAVSETNGKLRLAMLSEERLDRVKDLRAFPHHSAMACLNELGVNSPQSADSIVIDHIMRDDNWRLDQFRSPCSTANFLDDVDQNKIQIINHHLAHAYSVFYSSPYSDAAVLIVDGRGSYRETQSLFHATSDGIKLVAQTSVIGIGLLYAAVTHAIKFGLLQEGKTMGLAPYGQNDKRQFFDFSGRFDGVITDYSTFCVDGNYDIKASYPLIADMEDKAKAAFEVQEECERAMLHLAKFAKEQTRSDYLCLSGGVALNSVANYSILNSGIFKDIFINPAASDTGIPLGCALYGYYSSGGKERVDISPYLGPSYSKKQIERSIAGFSGFEIFRESARAKAVGMLAENKIVARFEGRSEMGPRALGHRSILMSSASGRKQGHPQRPGKISRAIQAFRASGPRGQGIRIFRH